MSSIQQIPFYLPLNVNFDSTQILVNNAYEDYSWAYSIGSSLFFYDPISKYVITDVIGDVVKEHIFVSINDSGFGFSSLYPVAIKSYKIDDKYNRYNPKTILIRSGISQVLGQLGTIIDTKYYFLPKFYLQKALSICNTEKVDFLLTSIVYKTNSIFNTLDYVNNEGNPSINFDMSKYIDTISYNSINYSGYPDILNHNDTIDEAIELFSPKFDYPLICDELTNVSINSDRVNFNEILRAISTTNPKEDNLAMTNTFVDKILNESTEVIYALNSVNYSEVFSFNTYALYELLQSSPFKEGYIKYILLPSNSPYKQLEVDTSSLLLVNWYYNLRYDGITHKRFPLTWISLLQQELSCLLDTIPTQDIVTDVEVIIQDYHVLIIINSNNKKLTIVFDMIVILLLSKTLFFTEDQYTNDQYCYYPSINL